MLEKYDNRMNLCMNAFQFWERVVHAIYLSIYLSILIINVIYLSPINVKIPSLSACPSVHPSICFFPFLFYPSIHPSVCLFVYLSIFLPICLSICTCICLSMELSTLTSKFYPSIYLTSYQSTYPYILVYLIVFILFVLVVALFECRISASLASTLYAIR